MRKCFLTLTVFLMVAGFTTSSHAVTFNYDIFPVAPENALLNNDYTHSFAVTTYNPSAQFLTLNNASVWITVTGLQNKTAGQNHVVEAASTSGNDILIGNLTVGVEPSFSYTDKFDLSSTLLTDIAGDNGNFVLKIHETTDGNHWQGATLNEVRFFGDYTLTNIQRDNPPVATPEPVTMTLFGIGLAGIGLLRRKNFIA